MTLQQVAFEAFRDLVKLTLKGLQDSPGISYAANKFLDAQVSQSCRGGSGNPSTALPRVGDASQGVATSEGRQAGNALGDDAEDDMIEAAEVNSDSVDAVALQCGVNNFTAQLQRAVAQEEDALEDALIKRKPRLSRRKMAMKVKRMVGEGLVPPGKSKEWFKELAARTSSWNADRNERTREAQDAIDPAAGEGPVALPAAGNIVYGKRTYTYRDQEEERAREAERGRITMNEARTTSKTSSKPSDRLKRLMAAQFNGNVAKDTKVVLKKRAQAEHDEQARAAIERHALSMGRGNSRR